MPDPFEIQREHRTVNDERSFRDDLQNLINKHCQESGSNTPDFVLANYLLTCLQVLDQAVKDRDAFYGILANGTGVRLVNSPDLGKSGE